MLIFDVFRGQITDKVTKFIKENNCVIVHVPNNMSDQFQPLDLNVNGHAKDSCQMVVRPLRSFKE